MLINFISELSEFELDNQKLVKDWIVAVIKQEKKAIGDIQFIFVNKKSILKINKTYLQHDYLTDIITFNNSFLNNVSGEIYICIPIVKENSGLHSNNNFLTELYRIIIHGVLHLVGYNDATEDDIIEMRAKENFYLQNRTF